MLPLFMVISSLVPVGGPDEIVLLNGEILRGRVEAVGQNGVIFIREESFQPRRISWEEIEARGILTTTSVTLHLTNGDRLSGTIAGVEGGYLKLISPVLGEISLEVASLREALSEGEAPPDLAYERALEQEVTQVQEEVAKDPDQILEPGPWKGSIALVGTLQYGGSDSGLAKLDFTIGKNWKVDSFDAGVSFAYGKSDGDLTAQLARGTAKWKHFYSEDFYSYLSGEALHDKIQGIKFRGILGIGAGYRVWHEGDERHLSFEGGLSGIYKYDYDDNSTLDPAARVAMDYKDIYWETVHFGQTLEWLQPLINTEAWIFRSVTSISVAVYEDWFVKNALEIDMLGDPSDDADTFNLLLTVGIEHKF